METAYEVLKKAQVLNDEAGKMLDEIKKLQKPPSYKPESSIKIEKNIPFPSLKKASISADFPFDKLDIGDSFFVEYEGGIEKTKFSNKVSLKASYASLKLHAKFSIRSSEYGVRVWRIS